MVNTPLTAQIESIKQDSCPQSLGFIRDLVDKSVEISFGRLGFEVEAAAQAARAEKSGGLHSLITSDVLGTAQTAFKDAFSTDIKSINNSTSLFENILGSLFDPESINLGLSKEYGLNKGASDLITFSGKVPLIQQELDRRFRKDANGDTDCARGVLVGTLNAVGSVTSGLAANALKSVSAAHGVLTMATNQISGFPDALLSVGVKGLQEATNDQTAILEQMRPLIESIQEDYAELDKEDFTLNHVEFIEAMKQFLTQASTRLSGVRVRLVDQGAGLDQDGYDAAKDLIAQVADTLCDVDEQDALGLNFSLRPLRILANTVLLEELNNILSSSADTVDSLSDNVADFVDGFETGITTDNLYAPIINELKCRLDAVIADMTATQRKNANFSFFIKEKQWCVELQVLVRLLASADDLLGIKDPTPEFLQKNLGLGLFGESTYLTRDLLQDDRDLQKQSQDSARSIVEAVEEFLTLVKRGLTTPLPPKLITARGSVVISKIDRRLSEIESSLGILSDFVDEIGTKFIQAVGTANQFLSYLGDRDLGSMAKALQEGDVLTAFSVDGLTSKIESLTQRYIDVALDCLAGGSVDATKRQELLKVNRVMQEDARASALYSSLVSDSSDRYVEEVLTSEIPRYRVNLDFEID